MEITLGLDRKCAASAVLEARDRSAWVAGVGEEFDTVWGFEQRSLRDGASGLDNFRDGRGDRWRKWAGSGRLALKWLYLRVRSRSQGCRVTLTAGATPVEGRRGFRWRVETALALGTFSCSRVREERGDGVKHSTTPDGQGVTTRLPSRDNTVFLERVPADSRSRSRWPARGDRRGEHRGEDPGVARDRRQFRFAARD